MIRKYTLIGLLSSFLLILLAVLFILIWEFRKDTDLIPQFIKDEPTENIPLFNPDENLTWQEELAKWPVRNYSPAAEEFNMYFDADTSTLREKKKYFQLIIDENDVYSMFCLRQTLNSFKIKYFLLNSGKSPEIFLDTNDSNLLEDIINELKKYQINTQVKEVWL